MSSVAKRMDGYRRRLVYEWQQWRSRTAANRTTAAIERWLDRLVENQPDVLVGANFAEYGGARQHMHAIEQFSSLAIELAPGENVQKNIHEYRFKSAFRDHFAELELPHLKAVHSHVFPWFIHWCEQHRKKTGVRWVHTHHNWYYPEFARETLEPWQKEFNDGFKYAMEHADVRLSVSKSQQRFLKDSFGLQSNYLPNGVDVSVCDRGNADRFRAQTGLTDFVFYAGRNDPVKNPLDFVRLAHELPLQQFLMVGQELSSEVMKNDWGVTAPNNLRIQGECSHKEVQDAIAACSVLIVTSKREGLPTLVMEAMAHRKPVVVPDEDGCLEVIGHGDFGFVYKQGDIDHLAAVTLEAKSDVVKCRRARHRVLQEYDWKVVAEKLDRVYMGEIA